MKLAESLIDRFTEWIAQRSDVQAAALVGSRARHAARAESDIDLVIITSTPDFYLSDDHWPQSFGEVTETSIEDWGLLQSKRVFYRDGLEVEYGITTSQWTETNPVDAGTAEVVKDGIRILFDPHRLLDDLMIAIAQA